MELKTCPFCKSGDVSRSQGQTGSGDAWQYIECETCGATASPERWNERPSEDEIQANYRYVSVLLGAAERQRDEALSMGTTVGSANPIRQVEQPAGTGHEATPKRSGNPSSSHPSIRRPTPEPQGEAVATVCLVGDRYAHGHMQELQVQLPPGASVSIGDKLYTRPQPGEGGGEVPDGSWLWCKLMDFCRKRRLPPAEYNDLFAIVTEAHELNALSKGGQGG